jgi:ABC-type molybdate transport system, ATPase component
MTLTVDLLHRFPDFELRAAFQAPRGLTAICGPSGAGKTTLINSLAGTISPSQGYIEINQRVLLDSKHHINLPPQERRVGYIYQDARLFPHLTVGQNLQLGRWFRKLPTAPEKTEHIIAMLGLGWTQQAPSFHPLWWRKTTCGDWAGTLIRT